MIDRISAIFDKAVWALLLAVAGFVASGIQSASKSIAELNEKMAVVIIQLSNSSKTIEDHEARIRRLEH